MLSVDCVGALKTGLCIVSPSMFNVGRTRKYAKSFAMAGGVVLGNDETHPLFMEGHVDTCYFDVPTYEETWQLMMLK